MSESKMTTIQNLLNSAESFEADGNVEAAKSYREKAERMMVQYAIDDAMLAKLREADGVQDKPETRSVTFGVSGSPVLTQYYNLMIRVAEHNRCKFIGFADGRGTLVGFPKDMDFVEMMFASIRLQMMNKVEPKPSRTKSFDENVWFLHECGVKWENIARLMNIELGSLIDVNDPATTENLPWEPVPWDEKKKDGGRLIRACKRYCRENDLEYRAISSPDVHLRSYAQGYLDEVTDRLAKLRAHQQDEIKSTSGAELVLVGRSDKVDSLYDEMFGDHKSKRANQKLKAEAVWRGRQDGRNADLSGGRNNLKRTKEIG